MAVVQVGSVVTLADGSTGVVQSLSWTNQLTGSAPVDHWRVACRGPGGLVAHEMAFTSGVDYGHVSEPRTFEVGEVVSVAGGPGGTILEVESDPPDSDTPLYLVEGSPLVRKGVQHPAPRSRVPGHSINL